MVDVLIARQGAKAGMAPAVSGPSAARAWALASAAMLLLLLAPALWNGFPLIFPDTGGYLLRPVEGALAIGRSALYGWFLYVGVPLAFWPAIVAQAAATAWVIVLGLRCHGLGGRPWLALGVVAMLSLVTSLPWFAAQLMPDILFPLAVLGLHLLAFRAAQLSRTERLGLAALVAVAIACHMAALGLCVGLVAAMWLLSRIPHLALPALRLSYAGGAVGAGFALCLMSNVAITGVFALTPGGASFLFGRLIEDGIVGRYLNERCPNRALRICDYARALPDNADDWLWANDTIFYKLGGWDGFGPEATRIILDSLKRYPLMHVKAAIEATVAQFTSFETEISIADNDPTYASIRTVAPQLVAPLMRAHQQAAPFDVAPLNTVHVPVGALAVAGIGVAFVLRRRLGLAPEAAALCLTILAALIINAAICGVFSHPVDRYQSRLVLLAPLALAIVAYRRRAPSPG